jgi:hypothetical protein
MLKQLLWWFGVLVVVLTAWQMSHRTPKKNTACFSVDGLGDNWVVTCRQIQDGAQWRIKCQDGVQPMTCGEERAE